MRRFQTLCKIALVAVVMLAAAGTPVVAKTMQANTRVERVEKKKQINFFSAWFSSIRSKLTRYAMAAS